MYHSGEIHATELPSGFKYIIGLSALFIAGCSAFFSVCGLGFLFAGAIVPVMIMASSLEIGKLVAASFLYRYWHHLNHLLKIYLLIAVLVLIGITSLGNYGYLARAYERTHTRVTLFEGQIAALENEIADTQRQIDASRGQLGKNTDASRENIAKIQQRISDANTSLEQSLARLQERRKNAQERRDRDIQVLTQQLAEKAEVLKKAINSEESAIADCNESITVLDRAVDAYTKEGGANILKPDSVKKGQELREKQRPERESIASQIANHRLRQEKLHADFAKVTEATDKELSAVRKKFENETAQFDTDEQDLRKSCDTAVAQTEQQLTTLQSQGETTVAGSDTQVEGLYQRIRARNDEIRLMKEQIAATDIGSYRFVARAFDAQSDSVVKWLTLVLVLVFDPLAVTLFVGFNVAILADRRRRFPSGNEAIPSDIVDEQDTPTTTRHNRWLFFGTSVLLLIFIIGAIIAATKWGIRTWHHQALASHAVFIPADSFAVVSVHPAALPRFAQRLNLLAALGADASTNLTEVLTQLLNNGVDSHADIYAFAKFPTRRSEDSGNRPVILVGLVMQLNNAAVAEESFSRIAEQFGSILNTNVVAFPLLTSNRVMVRCGQGRYIDPHGGFFTFGLTDRVAVFLLEFEGNQNASNVENEMRMCLAPDESRTGATTVRAKLPERALSPNGAITVWFDANRFFNTLPKNPAAQTRYEQLQEYLGFDLLLTAQPENTDQLHVTADYVYQAERFKDGQQSSAMQLLAGLGPVDPSGLAGRFMDRCVDTLDYDSLIERLRVALKDAKQKGVQDVVVEKSFISSRKARFVLTIRCDPQAGSSMAAVFKMLRE
jgi:predicted  nucleic acid-binding Zn-ribbon protein